MQILKVNTVTLTLLVSSTPSLVINAYGTVGSTGWKNGRLEPRFYIGGSPEDGIQDFDFVADPPFGIERQITQGIHAHLTWENPPQTLLGVRVHAKLNNIQKDLAEKQDITI